MAKSEPKLKPDVRIVQLFLKTIGGGLGLYRPQTKSWKTNLETEPLYQSNLEIVRAKLKAGWTAAELEETIRSRYQAGDRASLLTEVLPDRASGKRLDAEDNLIEAGIVYQHPALQAYFPPAFRCGNLSMVPVARGWVESRKSFTVRELLGYYREKMRELPPGDPESPALIGSFRYLLGAARLDEILTAIDLAAVENPRTPAIDLSRYLADAQDDVRRRAARAGETF